MAVPFIQSNSQASGASSVPSQTTAFLKNVTQGNTLIVAVETQSTTTTFSISDSQGNVYYPATTKITNATDSSEAQIFYAIANATGPNAVTLNLSVATTFTRSAIHEYLGTYSLDVFSTAADTVGSSVLNSGKAQTRYPNEIIFGWGISNNGVVNPGAGFTLRESPGSESTEDMLAVTPGQYSVIFPNTASSTWTASMAAFYLNPQPPVYPVNIAQSAGVKALGVLNSSQSSSQLVRTSSGNLYAVVTDAARIYVFLSTNNGVSWVEQNFAATPATTVSSIAAVIDGNDVIHIVYATSGVPKYVQFSTSANTFGRIESLPAVTGLTVVSIAVDSNGVPHVAAGGTNLYIYTNRFGGVWKANLTLSANSFINIDIQIDQNNVPQTSGLLASLGVNAFIGNRNNASSFTSKTIANNTNSYTPGGGTSLVVDSLSNTWLGFQSANSGPIQLTKHNQTDDWSIWQTPVTNGFRGKNISLAADGTDIYVFYERNLGGLAYDRYNSIQGNWLGEQLIQPNTPRATTNRQFHNPFIKWSNYFDNGLTGANNQNSNTIEYLFDDGATVYYSRLNTAQISTGLASFSFAPSGGTSTSTSSTSSSTSTSTSASTSTSSTSSSTSTSISTSTSSTSSSTSASTSTSSTSSSTSTSSTSSSTSISTSTSSTSSSTSTSTSLSTSSTSSSTSVSTSSTSSSTSHSTSSTSSSISTSSTSSSISTSSTSSSTSVSTSSTSSSISTSSTSSSISTSTSLSTSSTSSSISTSTSISTSSTSSSISTSSTSTSTTVSGTTTSTSTSSTSSSTSTSLSTSSTSSSTSLSTSSTSTSFSTSSTSSSTSHSTSSTSTSFSTSSTSSSTSHSTSSTSSSTSLSTSSTSSSTSHSTSTSSTSTSFSTSTTTTPVTTTSTSSTSSSTSSTTTLIDINSRPKVTIRPDAPRGRIDPDIMRTRIKLRLR